MTEAMQKFKNTLEKTATIAIRTGGTKDSAKILAAYILHSAFLKLGKKSNIETAGQSVGMQKFLKVFFDNLENSKMPENLLIKLDTKNIPVEELKYEKEGDILKLILKGGAEIDTENIIISKENAPVDLLMLIDTAENEIENILKFTPHQDVVKLSARPAGLGLKALDIFNVFWGNSLQSPSALPKELCEALWALLELEEKQTQIITKETLEAKKTLLEAEIDQKKIHTALSLLNEKGFWKLFGRALQRSEFEENIKTLWSFIPMKDFEASGQAAENSVLPILKEFERLRPDSDFFTLLFESSEKTIRAIISGRDGESTAAAAGMLGTAPASSYFFVNGFKTFSEAEIKIRSVLQKVLLKLK